MNHQQLPGPIRVRVVTVVGCCVLLLLLGLPLEIATVRSPEASVGARAFAFAFGVALPVLGLLAALRLARRYRTPSVQACRPTDEARRLLFFGRLACVLGGLAVGLVSGHLWWGWVAGVVGYAVVFWLARRQDPRLRWWGRATGPAERG